jgi:hypothetical protein
MPLSYVNSGPNVFLDGETWYEREERERERGREGERREEREERERREEREEREEGWRGGGVRGGGEGEEV